MLLICCQWLYGYTLLAIDGFPKTSLSCKGLTISGSILKFSGYSCGGGRWSSESEYQLNFIDMVCLQYTLNHPSIIINPTVPFLGVEDNVL